MKLSEQFDVAGVALVLVVLGGTGEAEGVVAHACVLHHLDQRHEVLVEILGPLPRMGIAETHECASGRHVQAAFDALIEPCPMKSLEVRALPPLNVDDLNPLAGAHLVTGRRAAIDPLIVTRVRQWLGKDRLARRRCASDAFDEHDDGRRRVLPVDGHRQAGRCHDHRAGAGRSE